MAFTIKTLDRVCLTLIVTGSIALGYWTLDWTFKQHRLLNQENKFLTKNLKDLGLAETNLQQFKTVLDAVRQGLNFLNQQIPESAKIGEFLKNVNLLVKARKVNLISLSPQPVVEEKYCNRIPIRLIFEGPFTNVYRVVNDLETMNRRVVIEKMQISKPNKTPLCRVDLTASVFERS
jgi:Tfp pilus assembly protein PilO